MTSAAGLFRPALLEGVAVATAGPARPAVADALAGLGADVRPLSIGSDEESPAEAAGIAALVLDAATAFVAAEAGDDELAALRAAGDGAWITTRSVANAAWIAEGRPGGKLVFVAPRPGDGPHAAAARAALENLARTLSIEWARYGIRPTTITPAAQTSDDAIAGVVAYLVSPAGDYFSGARLDLAR